MTYTKGPWTFAKTGTWPDTNHDLGIYSGSGTGQVAKIEGWGGEATANARLISAAPCMHQALKKAQLAIAKCLSVGGIQQPDESPDDWWPLLIEAQKEIAAAIRKSERGEV